MFNNNDLNIHNKLKTSFSDKPIVHSRAITLRWHLAAKVVGTGRQLLVKMREKYRLLLEQVLLALKEFEAPPI